MKKIRTVLVVMSLIAGSSVTRTTYDWPVHDPFTIVDTVSTLQFYGQKPGFHHGVDIHAPAGTEVFAPISGVVGMGYYYPPAQTPYTYEVTIDGDDGYRWEFHHIDQETIPPEIADLATHHGRVNSGALLAKIYDAPKFDPRILPHVHVDVIDKEGMYQNSLKLFPRFPDTSKPVIHGIYVVDQENHVISGDATGTSPGRSIPAGKYELVLDIIDVIDGNPMGDSVSRVSVLANQTAVGSVDFSEHLPKKNYLEGVSDVYKIDSIVLPNGQTLTNQVDLANPRKFLYRFMFDTSKIPTGANGEIEIEVTAKDFVGNEATRVFRLIRF